MTWASANEYGRRRALRQPSRFARALDEMVGRRALVLLPEPAGVWKYYADSWVFDGLPERGIDTCIDLATDLRRGRLYVDRMIIQLRNLSTLPPRAAAILRPMYAKLAAAGFQQSDLGNTVLFSMERD